MTYHITVIIVNYNQDSWLLKCIKALSFNNINYRVLIISNSTIEKQVYEHLAHIPNIEIITNDTNKGFAYANNQGFDLHKTDYFLVLNPDVLVTPMFIKELLISIEKDSSIGMVCGKLLRCTEGGKPTNIIDSTGLVLTKNRRAFDRGQGKVDIGQFDKCEYVFGCCGAAVLYRKTMLEDIKVYDEFFDNDFFAYKEDVDLSWRAQLNGWKAFYNYRAIGYHARGWKKGQRNIISRSVQIHSYKNRYLMLIKNEILINFLIHLPYILLYELCAIFYLSFKSPYLIKGWIQIKKLLPSMLKKRKIIQNNKKLTAKQFRDLIS